jgi:hypothetical protein
MDPNLMDWLLDELMAASFEVRAQWIKEAMTGAWNERPALGSSFLKFVAHTMTRPGPGDHVAAFELAEAIRVEYGPRLTSADIRHYVAIETLALYSLIERADAALKARDVAAAQDLWSRARKWVRETRDRVGDLPYAMTASEAFVAALQAENEGDKARKPLLRTEAITLLRIATASDLLESELEKSPDDASKRQVRWFHARCIDRLQKLEIEDEASSR